MYINTTVVWNVLYGADNCKLKIGGTGDRHTMGMDYLSWTRNLNYVIQRLHKIWHYKHHLHLLCNSLCMTDYLDNLDISTKETSNHQMHAIEKQFQWRWHGTSNHGHKHQTWNTHSLQMDLSKYIRLAINEHSERASLFITKSKLCIHMNHHLPNSHSQKHAWNVLTQHAVHFQLSYTLNLKQH
jgi:hypothetical protein